MFTEYSVLWPLDQFEVSSYTKMHTPLLQREGTVSSSIHIYQSIIFHTPFAVVKF